MNFYNVLFDAIHTVLYDYGNKDGMMMIMLLFYLNRFILYVIQKQKWITPSSHTVGYWYWHEEE